jgi:plasmid stability protein
VNLRVDINAIIGVPSSDSGFVVASLLIRDLDEEVKARLRVRAAEHGRSMEAEARAMIASALDQRTPERGLGSHIREGFADIGGIELEIAPRTERAGQTVIDA